MFCGCTLKYRPPKKYSEAHEFLFLAKADSYRPLRSEVRKRYFFRAKVCATIGNSAAKTGKYHFLAIPKKNFYKMQFAFSLQNHLRFNKVLAMLFRKAGVTFTSLAYFCQVFT